MATTIKPCDRTHTSYAERGVIDYAKGLHRVCASGDLESIAAAFRRLNLAVKRLRAEEAREKSRRAK